MTFSDQPAWYCLKTQPKRERAAAVSLRELGEVEVLFPQVRYVKQSSKGKRAVLEPMFPNYLFARFAPLPSIRAVGYARGVAYVVKSGSELTPVHDGIIREIRSLAADEILDLPLQPVQPGEKIRIIAGIFEGESADVVRLIPGAERVKLLLELLGRQSEIELSLDEVERRYGHPLKSNEGS